MSNSSLCPAIHCSVIIVILYYINCAFFRYIALLGSKYLFKPLRILFQNTLKLSLLTFVINPQTQKNNQQYYCICYIYLIILSMNITLQHPVALRGFVFWSNLFVYFQLCTMLPFSQYKYLNKLHFSDQLTISVVLFDFKLVLLDFKL